MSHAARYVEVYNGKQINSWTSKLGQDILVAHELQDLLNGYGTPVCYAYQLNSLFGINDEL